MLVGTNEKAVNETRVFLVNNMAAPMVLMREAKSSLRLHYITHNVGYFCHKSSVKRVSVPFSRRMKHARGVDSDGNGVKVQANIGNQ